MIFKYHKGGKFIEIFTITFIIVMAIFIIQKDTFQWMDFLEVVLVTAGLNFLINYVYLLNESVQINEASLIIHRKIGKTTEFSFDKIRKVILQEIPSAFNVKQLIMTVFGEKKNKKIIVSDLEEYEQLIKLLEKKGALSGFKVIHQAENNKVVNSL